VGPDSPAAPYLAAGLEIAGVRVPVSDVRFKSELIALFDANLAMSKPIGFYTWNDDLRECFRFLRFFQQEFGLDHPLQFPAVQAMAAVLAEDDALRAEYEQAIAFYARLTNPMIALSIADLIGTSDPAALRQMCKDRGLLHEAVAVFPASTSRETVLFETMFPEGLPPNTDLMQALIRAVRSGKIDLAPTQESGWYEHQAYALETLLLPERAEECVRLESWWEIAHNFGAGVSSREFDEWSQGGKSWTRSF
jgi:hypothetical protein